jgi:hypothetical protein
MMSWENIETAPRDGSKILGYGDCGYGYEIVEFDVNLMDWYDSEAYKCYPKFWQPLDAPPEPKCSICNDETKSLWVSNENHRRCTACIMKMCAEGTR